MKLTSELRLFVGLAYRHNRTPIEIIKGGYNPPKILGKSYHWTNKSGSRVVYPMSYAKKGFSSLIYHKSTKRIEVGEGWLRCYGLLK